MTSVPPDVRLDAATDAAVAPPAVTPPDLARKVRRGLAWSGLGSLALRAGNLLTGIVLARLLAPEDFGVFAVALTVQAVLVTLADLGMSADLVRSDDPGRRAPTVATLSLAASTVLAASMALAAGPTATLLGSPAASGPIVVLAASLLLSGAGVVPYAHLQREFAQSKLFAIDATNFVVGTSVTILLVLLGMGPMALAVSRLVGQALTLVLQFRLARIRPRFGLDRAVVGGALRFGLPLALANMLSWALLNVDNVVVARSAGEVALGFYVLAFNVSSWPTSAISQAVRSVTLAAFSRTQQDGSAALARATALSTAAAVPVGALLAVLALPTVVLLYGDRWQPSALALAGLGAFGALRVVLDVFANWLVARGSSRPVLLVQVVWLVTLTPAVVVGTRWGGIAGAGWAHLVVGLLVVLPAYLVSMRGQGADVRAVLRSVAPPVVAMVPAALLAHLAAHAVHSPVLSLLAGGTVGVGVYALLIARWLLPRIRTSAGTSA